MWRCEGFSADCCPPTRPTTRNILQWCNLSPKHTMWMSCLGGKALPLAHNHTAMATFCSHPPCLRTPESPASGSLEKYYMSTGACLGAGCFVWTQGRQIGMLLIVDHQGVQVRAVHLPSIATHGRLGAPKTRTLDCSASFVRISASSRAVQWVVPAMLN
ncbi:hypothetical protein COO60DRAFT_776065 [Scenedesmus sp. NREL 46B-D3]|nr:hypothetical protein COO60DRAFT_776065 [Scenedesmus sp. NREL 46B-D3]